ncbi:MAG: hypothetical protein E7639_05470 [Ruminococcaceae bacterium]|nr:hypothetical protein [Oscillospiraceae bacterium]
MKKFLLFSLLLLSLFTLFACDNAEEPAPDGSVQMIADIKSMGEKIEVEVLESEYASGIYLVITGEQTTYLDSEGNTLSRTDLSVGDTVKIQYNGQVMMSLPPQIVAVKIIVQS